MVDKSQLAENKMHAALSKEEEEKYATTYMGDLLDNIRSADDRLRAATRTIVLFVVIFELLTRATISEITFAGFKVDDSSLIQKSLPAVLGYLFYWSTVLLVHRSACKHIYKSLMKETFPDYSRNDLGSYPIPPSILETPRLIGSFLESWGEKMTAVLTIPLLLVISLGPVVFEYYAFYRLFDIYESHDPIVWASLILAVYFLCGVYLGLTAVGALGKLADRIPKKSGSPRLPEA
jgi:hypothetical protein